MYMKMFIDSYICVISKSFNLHTYQKGNCGPVINVQFIQEFFTSSALCETNLAKYVIQIRRKLMLWPKHNMATQNRQYLTRFWPNR